MNKNLMAITLESLAFMDLCGPEVVHPDVATSQTQQILSGLDLLTDEEKGVFASFALTYANLEESLGHPCHACAFFDPSRF